MDEIKLPPLPEYFDDFMDKSKELIFEYGQQCARAAIEADRQSRNCGQCVPLSTDGTAVFINGVGEVPLDFSGQARGEPVAWLSDSPTKGNGRRLFWTKAEAWRWSSNIEPLYTTPQIPEGYKLVPIEPIDEMIEAGCALYDSSLRQRYRAMLEAAPQPTRSSIDCSPP